MAAAVAADAMRMSAAEAAITAAGAMVAAAAVVAAASALAWAALAGGVAAAAVQATGAGGTAVGTGAAGRTKLRFGCLTYINVLSKQARLGNRLNARVRRGLGRGREARGLGYSSLVVWPIRLRTAFLMIKPRCDISAPQLLALNISLNGT